MSDFGRSLRNETFKFAVVQPAHYNSNVANFSQPAGKTVDGKPAFVWSVPTEGKIATFDVADYGLWVQAAIENQELQGDEDVLAATDEISGKEFAEIISKSTHCISSMLTNRLPLRPRRLLRRRRCNLQILPPSQHGRRNDPDVPSFRRVWL